jgi:hypothetical protein
MLDNLLRIFLGTVLFVFTATTQADENFEFAWRYSAPSGACEIAAYSAATEKLFVTVGGGVDVLSVASGTRQGEVAIPNGFHATSVACSIDVLAIAWAADDKRERGKVTFYNAMDLKALATHEVGYLPDMIVFTPDGQSLLAANESEPSDDYSFDPEASISVITKRDDWKSAKVREPKFDKFNSDKKELRAAGVHLFGPNNASVAQDVEPEYIAISSDAKTAWITLQENNAIAELDIEQAKITAIHPLGLKSFRSLGGVGEAKLVSHTSSTGLDVSDQDGGVRIRHWPIWAMYQPDGIATFQQAGEDYLVTANEGDPRDYYDFHEAIAVGELEKAGIKLDLANPARRLTGNDQLGRWEVSRWAGDTDGDGDLDRLVGFGGRSFSVWRCGDEGLELVFDSGSDIEQTIAQVAPDLFNVDSQLDSPIDVRSPIRGPEPENLVVFEIGRRRFTVVGLERTGGALVYDISDPTAPAFVEYITPHESGGIRDLAPEGLLYISGEKAPDGKPLLILSNEGSGTLTAYEVGLK